MDTEQAASHIAALHRERHGYLVHGHIDRADQVAAVLAAMGAPVDTLPDTTKRQTARPNRRPTKDAPPST